MKIGTVKEIKKHEYRVGMTPDAVRAYSAHGHTVYIEKGAGEGAGFDDAEYEAAGAKMLSNASDVFSECDMIVKVKEPLPDEYELMRKGQIIYTYLHLAASEDLTMAMLKRKVKGVAYETIQDANGGLPCLRPMSEIAGRLSVQEGAKFLEKPFGGRGVLLGGVPGVSRGKVAILGGGTVGANACRIAVGMGAQVTVLDLSLERLAYLDDIYRGEITTLYSTQTAIEDSLAEADLVIGAVLIPGAAAPKLIKRSYLSGMKKGSVIVDVAVDQGGCCETTHATYHNDPVFMIDDVVNYCVANMPGSVPRTATQALNNATLSYGLKIADMGLEEACKANKSIATGVNIYNGLCTYENVATCFGLKYTPVLHAIRA
jgi:alanine dehydrogenase